MKLARQPLIPLRTLREMWVRVLMRGDITAAATLRRWLTRGLRGQVRVNRYLKSINKRRERRMRSRNHSVMSVYVRGMGYVDIKPWNRNQKSKNADPSPQLPPEPKRAGPASLAARPLRAGGGDRLIDTRSFHMPAKYLALRDEFIREGKPAAKAKASAARIYNAERKPGTAPVVPGAYERSLADTVTRKRY